MPKIAVIGGGISGLTAAYRLLQAGATPVLLEHSPRLGGAIRTFRDREWLMEAGPDSLLRVKPAALELAKELEVELIEAQSQGPPGIVRGGQVLPLPDGLRLMAPTQWIPFLKSSVISWPGKIRALCEALVPKRTEITDESVASFVSRRFGMEVMEILAQPLVGGIYAADLSRLSLQATLPMFEAMERSKGSVTAGLLSSSIRSSPPVPSSLFLTPRYGIEAIVNGLVERLPQASVRLCQPVLCVSRRPQGWKVETTTDSEFFDGILFACSNRVAARLLARVVPEVQNSLGHTVHVSTATVHLKLEADQITRPLTGSGFVVPHLEGLDITACTYSHRKFAHRAPPGHALLRIHLGNAMNPYILRCDDFQLMDRAIQQITPILGLRGGPKESYVARHSKVLPQYGVGHCQRVLQAQTSLALHSGLALAGNGLSGVGLADCVSTAQAAVKSLLGALR